MSKNNALIAAMKMAKRETDNITPAVYASIAIALHRKYGFGYERINNVFSESQRIWTEFAGNIEEMIALCEQETGITLARRKD